MCGVFPPQSIRGGYFHVFYKLHWNKLEKKSWKKKMSNSKSMQLDDYWLNFRDCQVLPKGDIDRNVRLYKFYR